MFLLFLEMEQMKMLTNTGKGLYHALSLFAVNNDDSHKLVILITDGVSTDSPLSAATELKDKVQLSFR